MSKHLKPKLIAGAVAGLAVAGGGAAIAATQFASPKADNQAIVNDAASQLGIKPSELSAALKKALENRVDAAVAAGRLTKAQGDQLKQRIEAGDVPLFAGPGVGGRHFGGHFGGLETAATYLGLTQAELRTQLSGGKTLAEVAKARDKSVDGLIQALVDAAKKRLDADVTAGRLTRAQADQMLADVKSHTTDFVNGKAPRFERFRRGPRPEGPGFGGPGI